MITKKLTQNKHIVLVGLNFCAFRHAGDKNFWLDMLTFLAQHLDHITILSIRNNPISFEEFSIDNCKILIKYIVPKFLRYGDIQYQKENRKTGRPFPTYSALLEKITQSRAIRKELANIYAKIPYKQVHLMDNFGLSNRQIAGVSPTPVSVSAMGYQGKNKLIYDNYLRLSYKHTNLTVVPYSLTYAEKLHKLGIDIDKIVRIPWGVETQIINDSKQKRTNTEIYLSSSSNKPIFLWTGYIQQIREEDFFYALDTARLALQKGLEALFYFAFKPGSFDENFMRFHCPEKGIFIMQTTQEQFNCLKDVADIFYSPVLNEECIVAPPLTWIEMLAQGIPIITTNVGGAHEVVVDGTTGFMAENADSLINLMFKIKTSFSTMKSACIAKVKNNYNLDDIARKYLDLWFEKQI